MTFAQAEKERSQRILQLALLGSGDIIGLDAYVCDLFTYTNSARCTAPCDLFYILKHNFLRLQKRHGTQGLSERLREIVRLSLQAYPLRIVQLPLFTALTRKQLALPITDEQQQQYHSKQSWLLHVNNTMQAVSISYGIGLGVTIENLEFTSTRYEKQTTGGEGSSQCQKQRQQWIEQRVSISANATG